MVNYFLNIRQRQILLELGRAFHAVGLDHAPYRSKPKLFRIELSYLHVSKEDSINPRHDQLECQLFEAEYFADEDSVLVPANVAAVVDSSQLSPCGYLNSGNFRGSRIALGM
jgi:hypothetical protein